MKKIMFNNKYGLTQAVLDLLKTMTRRIISEKEWDKIHKFKEEYYEQTFDRLEEKELIKTYFDTYPERIPYKVGEVVAIAQSYRDVAQGGYPIDSRYKLKDMLYFLFGPKCLPDKNEQILSNVEKTTSIYDNKEKRLNIAAMAMQGLLNATSVERFTLRINPEAIAEAAFEYADALIAKADNDVN